MNEPCENGCNGCDECTDFDDDPMTLEIRAPNAEGSTMCIVRWQVETPHGWIGAWDRAALGYVVPTSAICASHTTKQKNMTWQPIETAPKDGTLILVHFGIKGVRAVSWDDPFNDERSEENGLWCVDDDKHGPYPLRGYSYNTPTAPSHWMPLPPPPEA